MKNSAFCIIFSVFFFAPTTILLANDCLREAEFYRLNIIRDLPNEKTKRNLINCLLLLPEDDYDQIVLYSPDDGTLVQKDKAPSAARGGSGMSYRCLGDTKCGPEVSNEELASSLGKICKDWCGNLGAAELSQQPSIGVLKRIQRENFKQQNMRKIK